jgi:hypothetical protein
MVSRQQRKPNARLRVTSYGLYLINDLDLGKGDAGERN